MNTRIVCTATVAIAVLFILAEARFDPDAKRKACTEVDVLSMYADACQLPPGQLGRRKRAANGKFEMPAGMPEETELSEQLREKRDTSAFVRRLINRCCRDGCTVQEFRHFGC